jgi:hypothetical protein
VISKYGNKTTCKRLVYSRELSQTFVDRCSPSNGQLYTILTTKAAKGKKGTIVATITGTKAQTVVAIMKTQLKRRNTVSENNTTQQQIWINCHWQPLIRKML